MPPKGSGTAPDEHPRRGEELALALTLTVTAVVLHGSRLLPIVWQRYLGTSTVFTYYAVVELVFLALALVLAVPARRRSGITLGRRPPSWWALAAIVGLSPGVVALIYSVLPERPFSLGSRAMWLISPTAQEVWYLGVIYGRLERVFPDYVHPRLHIRQALLLTAGFFSLAHFLGGVYSMFSPAFVALQVVYTLIGFVIVGLSRQWTGSVLYAAVTHTAVNYIAWRIPY